MQNCKQRCCSEAYLIRSYSRGISNLSFAYHACLMNWNLILKYCSSPFQTASTALWFRSTRYFYWTKAKQLSLRELWWWSSSIHQPAVWLKPCPASCWTAVNADCGALLGFRSAADAAFHCAPHSSDAKCLKLGLESHVTTSMWSLRASRETSISGSSWDLHCNELGALM